MYVRINNVVGDFTMVAIQLCGKAIEEARLAAQAQAQAEAEAEKAKKSGKEQESWTEFFHFIQI